MERMTAVDAQTYWMSAKIPNDQFLLFCFTGVEESMDAVASGIRLRAAGIADLRLRVRAVPATLDYPYWVPTPVADDQVRVHRAPVRWNRCLHSLADAMGEQLDVGVGAWRVHVFGPIRDAPGTGGEPSVVAVLQVSHALADGSRASAIARELFDGSRLRESDRHIEVAGWMSAASVLAARGILRLPAQLGRLGWWAFRAHRAYVAMSRDIATGVVAAPTPGGPRVAVNTAPGDRRRLRVVLTSSARLTQIGGTVTVGALVVIGEALSEHLSLPPDQGLRAEVTVAKPGQSQSRNNFRNSGIDLHVDERDRSRRAELIRDELEQIRARIDRPSTAAESAAMSALPAALIHWGAASFDTSIVPDRVSGNTVVSSVNRGADDLVLGGGRVRFTAGFPALSPVQSLTHGVHGIGAAVAISLTASPEVVQDLDAYGDRIERALAE